MAAYHLICAAQLFTHLLANCKQRKPDHKSQLRPLIGLSLEQALLAWERAAENAGGRRITTRLNLARALTSEPGRDSVPPASRKAPCLAGNVERYRGLDSL